MQEINTQDKIYYNCHAHCFTIDHVPNHFVKGLVWFPFLFPIRWIKNKHVIRRLIIFLNRIRFVDFIAFFAPDFRKSYNRILAFAEFFNKPKNQQEIIDQLMGFYPPDTRFVLLMMDMEYMDAGKPIKNFESQLNELASIKNDSQYRNKIYPFVFADPRRPAIINHVKEAIEKHSFSGIKIYPALGYFPFDKGLKDVYKYALEKNLPITTHCIRGAVYYRGSKKKAFDNATHHPIALTQPLFGKKGMDFTMNFTHPLNYKCLMDVNILKNYWGQDAPDFKNLKMCIGHFGGEDEWDKYLNDLWAPQYTSNNLQNGPLDISQPWFDITKKGVVVTKAYSWFSVVCEMMLEFPNMYADISYTLSDDRIFPLLKLILSSNYPNYERIRDRILFGTDFFVVSKAGADRDMSIKLREYLGDTLFELIACKNPSKFL